VSEQILHFQVENVFRAHETLSSKKDLGEEITFFFHWVNSNTTIPQSTPDYMWGSKYILKNYFAFD
jgi:hypothetical protein